MLSFVELAVKLLHVLSGFAIVSCVTNIHAHYMTHLNRLVKHTA